MVTESDLDAEAAHYSSLDEAWKRYKQQGDLKAKEFIIIAYKPMVESSARRIYAKKPWIFDLADLKQAGMIGLIHAVERYDPERGIKFGTYAPRRVSGAILDEVNSVDWTPRGVRQKIRKTVLALQEFSSKGNNSPSNEEIAKKAGIEPGEVYTARKNAPKTHVGNVDSHMVHTLEQGAIAQYTSVSKTPETDTQLAIDRVDQRVEIAKALGNCTEEETQVILMHFYDGKTLKQIGEELGFSSSKISSIKKSALTKLYNLMDKDDWDL